METKGLLFIPDISGFTKFVSQTDIQHSRLIIQELLELLIDANEMGLEISEVEGDAILFYKFGECPDLSAIYKQVQKMFCEFHRRLSAYDKYKFCQCNACLSAVGLSLKVITHYGEFSGYTVQNFSKLIGKDVIVAHQLLKNDIDQHEYWLVTDNLLGDHQPVEFAEWMQWDHSIKKTESGEVPFHYTQLARLKLELGPEPPPQLELKDKVRVINLSKDFETDIIRLFHAAGDFRYRDQWQDGVTAVEEVSHFLPRVGMRYRKKQERGDVVVFASGYSYSPDLIQFSETDEEKKSSTHYRLETLPGGKIRLTLDYYIPQNAGRLLFNLFHKKKIEKQFRRSLANLENFVKQVKLPDEV
jgi:hypothetical protein